MVPPKRVQVFGERASGTNFVKRLIGRNTALTPIEDLGWKHGFPQMIAVPEDVLVIAVVRDARAWALSMFARPWHTPPAMQRLDFPAFLRADYATIADRARYFPQIAAHGGLGQPLQADRHPLTGAVFPNILALRRAKLAGHLSLLVRTRPAALVRLEVGAGRSRGFSGRPRHHALPCAYYGIPPGDQAARIAFPARRRSAPGRSGRHLVRRSRLSAVRDGCRAGGDAGLSVLRFLYGVKLRASLHAEAVVPRAARPRTDIDRPALPGLGS